MTTPTPAQIIAAREAVWSIAPSGLWTKEQAERIAEAALTAAAQVGEQEQAQAMQDIARMIETQTKCARLLSLQLAKTAVHLIQHGPMSDADFDKLRDHTTTAAQVGEPIYTQSQCDSMVGQTWSATIERCAQVAERMQKIPYGYQEPSPIAAAIRKLKDEP